ncbi:MAG: hypothetical protein ACAH04_05485 [Methylibium sp.]
MGLIARRLRLIRKARLPAEGCEKALIYKAKIKKARRLAPRLLELQSNSYFFFAVFRRAVPVFFAVDFFAAAVLRAGFFFAADFFFAAAIVHPSFRAGWL